MQELCIGSAWHFTNIIKYDRRLEAFEGSEKINGNGSSGYNMACIYAVKGEREKAFEWLDKAIAGGFNDLKTFRADAELNSLRETARFKLLEEKIDRAVRPCKYDAAARQFDFWIGNWDVKTTQGQLAGTNNVVLLEDGCLIEENWIGSLGGTGKSMNFYDTQTKKWRQIWVDSTGGSTLFVGEMKDGSMVYDAEKTGTDGKRFLSRLTFTPIDKTHVRQHGERSDDTGKTWNTTFDFTYVLKASEKKP